MGLKLILKEMWAIRNVLLVVLIPILLLPIPFAVRTVEARCAYGILVVALYWITEALPIAVTSFLPVIIFPMLQVAPAKNISKQYLNDTTMLFLGGLMIAIAIERWNLHKRIALRVLLLFGSQPRSLLLGLMVPTWFLSMWISNTATTAMMMPIADAVLQQLKFSDTKHSTSASNAVIEMDEVSERMPQSSSPSESKDENIEADKSTSNMSDVDRKFTWKKFRSYEKFKSNCTALRFFRIFTSSSDRGTNFIPAEDKDRDFNNFCKAVSLCIAYAANTGGTATLTGTGPNLVLKGQADLVFNKYGLSSGVTFVKWMMFGLPLSAINLLITWVWLQIFYLRCTGRNSCGNKKAKKKEEKVKALITEELTKLGPVSFAEVMVLIHFLALAVLWITRDMQSAGGWGHIFGEKYVSDSTAAIFIGILLFIVPSKLPRLRWKASQNNEGDNSERWPTLLTWNVVQEKMQWGIVILLGGGFAIANVSRESGLSESISKKLIGLSSMSPWVMSLVLAFIVATATEITSNTATATLLMPIMSQLALGINMNPLYLMFPAALACSFAFMLPVATPPNAIVFAMGYLKVSDMAGAGLLINVVCVLTLTLAVHTWGDAIFHFSVIPSAFNQTMLGTTLSTNC